MATPSAPVAEVTHRLAMRARWRPLEYVFWLAALASVFLLPGRHLILTEIAWLGLFALSLDLILGYAGIISLGHAAFFGLGSYVAALLAKHAIISEPVLALIVSGLVAAALGFATSFLVLRGSDLTRLMVTLGVSLVCYELANKFGELTGGADGLQGVTMAPILGTYRFDMFGHTAYVYTLVWLLLLFLIIGGTGYLYGGIVGALIYRLLQDYLSDLTARYWQFWIGLLLVAIVIVGRDRIGGWINFVEMLPVRLFRRATPGGAASPD